MVIRSKILGVRLEPEMLERLRAVAAANGIQAASFVALMIADYLNTKHPKPPEIAATEEGRGGRGEPVPPAGAKPKKAKQDQGANKMQTIVEKPKKAPLKSQPSKEALYVCKGLFCDWKGTQEQAVRHPKKGLLCPECGGSVKEQAETKTEPRKGFLETIL